MSQTLQTALTHAGQRLSGAGIEDSRREARILLAFVLGIDALQVSFAARGDANCGTLCGV
jgi:hypothetical protein